MGQWKGVLGTRCQAEGRGTGLNRLEMQLWGQEHRGAGRAFGMGRALGTGRAARGGGSGEEPSLAGPQGRPRPLLQDQGLRWRWAWAVGDCLGPWEPSTLNRGLKQQTFASQGSGGQTSRIKVLWAAPSEGSWPSLSPAGPRARPHLDWLPRQRLPVSKEGHFLGPGVRAPTCFWGEAIQAITGGHPVTCGGKERV